MTALSANDEPMASGTSPGSPWFDLGEPVTESMAEMHREYRWRAGDRHLWVVGIIHRVDDPDTAETRFKATEDNLIGASSVHCMWCSTDYEPRIRFAHCYGPAETRPALSP